jgi:DNA-binding protein HU-beta
MACIGAGQQQGERTMSKKDLVAAVAEAADISKDKANAAVDAIADHITKQLKKGEEVSFPPLGKFKVTKREARTGRNPSTGATVDIPASNVPKFAVGKALKDAVN